MKIKAEKMSDKKIEFPVFGVSKPTQIFRSKNSSVGANFD
jgi:hypothetical protein